MFTELLPFWTKYWYHVLITIILCIFFKLFYKVFEKGTIFIENNRHNFNILDNTVEQLEGNNTITLLLSELEYEIIAIFVMKFISFYVIDRFSNNYRLNV